VLQGAPLTFYGDGHQVRDLLYAEDLVDAMQSAIAHVDEVGGRAFNIGGGPGNAASLLEVVRAIGELHADEPEIRYAPWRQGDQRYYVSDTRAFRAATGWRPRHGIEEGVERLYRWLEQHETALAAATA
jgi:CDP-paratose 2-epimerase